MLSFFHGLFLGVFITWDFIDFCLFAGIIGQGTLHGTESKREQAVNKRLDTTEQVKGEVQQRTSFYFTHDLEWAWKATIIKTVLGYFIHFFLAIQYTLLDYPCILILYLPIFTLRLGSLCHPSPSSISVTCRSHPTDRPPPPVPVAWAPTPPDPGVEVQHAAPLLGQGGGGWW